MLPMGLRGFEETMYFEGPGNMTAAHEGFCKWQLSFHGEGSLTWGPRWVSGVSRTLLACLQYTYVGVFPERSSHGFRGSLREVLWSTKG